MSDRVDTEAVRLWLSVMTDDAEVIEKVAQLICSQGPWERVSPYNQQRAREMAAFVTPIVGRVLAALAESGDTERCPTCASDDRSILRWDGEVGCTGGMHDPWHSSDLGAEER